VRCAKWKSFLIKNLCDDFSTCTTRARYVECVGRWKRGNLIHLLLFYTLCNFDILHYSNWLACSVCFMLCYFFLFTKRWLSVGFASLSMETCSFFLSLSLCFPGSSSLISLLPPFCYNHSLHSCRPIDNQHRRGPAERDARWATQLGRDPKANLVGAPPLLSLFNISNCLSKLGNECLSRYRDWDWHNWIDFWTLSL
jgi:hypothetical protein